MGMYKHKMPDRELSEEMTKADYWEVQADMWHQNYKEAADEIERLREENNDLKSALMNVLFSEVSHVEITEFTKEKE